MRTLILAVVVATALLSATDAWADDNVKIAPDVVYGHKDGLAMTFDVYTPAEGANGAGVLFMVSGGWFSTWAPPENFIPVFTPLLDKGFTVFAVRHGSSPKYVVPEAVEDVRRAVRFIRLHAEDYGISADRLGVFGGSAGGHLSLMLGNASDEGDSASPDEVLQQSSRVAAVVAIYPPTDLRLWVPNRPDNIKSIVALDFDPELADDVSPLVHASEDDPPTLMIHGTMDEIVPISHSEHLQAEFEKLNVTSELMVIDGAGHGFQGDDNVRVVAALVAWFEKHLAAAE